MQGKSRFQCFPLVIFCIALGLRLIPVLLTPKLGIGLDDMFQYDMLARSLAAGNGFRWYAPPDLARLAPYLHLDMSTITLDPRGMLTTFRAPLYPAFLAVVYAAVGVNGWRFFAVRLIQAAVGATLPPMTYLVAHQLLGPSSVEADAGSEEAGARWAAAVVAAYPMLLVFPLALATENLFFPLVLGSVLVLLRICEGPKSEVRAAGSTWIGNGTPILAGLLLGLAALTRSVILPFAGLAILWIWLVLKQPRAAAITALALFGIIAPWIVRNSLVSHRLTGIETSMGYNLYVGYHPQSTGTFAFGPSLDLLSIVDDQARDQIGTQRALDFVREDPLRFPYLAVRRLGYFFNLELRAFTYFYVNDFLGSLSPAVLILILSMLAIPFVVVGLMAAFGACALPGRPATVLMGLLFGGYLLPHVLILSEERFHLTLIPFFAICAANASLNRTRFRRPALLCAIAIGLLLVCNWSLELVRDGHTLSQLLGVHGNQLYLPY